MGRKLTQEEFIAGCRKTHNHFYTYENTAYVRGKDKIVITCPRHGNFTQQAQAHKNDGDGCQECAREAITGRPSVTTEDFVKRSREIHEDRYTYEKTVVATTMCDVVITCPVHKDFIQPARSHLAGHGCKACSDEASRVFNRSNSKEFISKAKALHKGLFSYEKVEYLDSSTPVLITCPVHNDFKQTPASHLQGSGCPKCVRCGFNTGSPGYLYVLASPAMTKVGITNRPVATRVREIENTGGPKFSVVSSMYFEQGLFARNIERAAHKWLKTKYKQPQEKFPGYTECFLDVDMEELIKFLIPIATTPEPAQASH